MPEIYAALVVLAVVAYFIGFWNGWKLANRQQKCRWPADECALPPGWKGPK